MVVDVRTYLEDISAKILLILDLERDLPAHGRDSRAGLDFVVTISTQITVDRHDQNILEVRNIDLLDESIRLVSTARTCTREDINLLVLTLQAPADHVRLSLPLGLFVGADKSEVDVLLARAPVGAQVPLGVRHAPCEFEERVACRVVDLDRERTHREILL